jgi:hypothetical protein
MTRVEYEESDEDDGTWASVTLTIISSDPALLAKAKRALRSIMVDEAPKLTTIKKKDED